MAAESEINENDFEKKFYPSFDNEGIPACLEWTVEDVAEWIEYLGFPQYKVRFSRVCLASKVQKFMVCYCFY